MLKQLIAVVTVLTGSAGPASASETAQYKYDAMGRLVLADVRNPAGSGRITGYGHDKASNRMTVQASIIVRSAIMPSSTTLQRGQAILSADGRYVMALQYDGNLVLYDANFVPRWATSKFSYTVSRLEMQSDGNLVTYDMSGQPIWSTDTWGHPGSYLAVQNDGSLVVYSSSGSKLWSSA